MYEINFLAVGEESQSGDATAQRYSLYRRETPAIVIVNAGFQDSGLGVQWFF
jgi:hypothetical protein